MKHIPIPPLRALRRLTVAAVLCALSMAAPLAHPASAQERSGNFLENLFNRGEPPAPQQGAQPQGQVAQGQGQGMASDPSDPGVRIDRLEGALRQLTGTVEQLQYRNQQLEMQLKRMQDDTEFRLQQLGSKGPPSNAQPTAPNVPGAPVPAGRRSDVFDPSQNPNAPGAPRTLGNASAPIDQPVGVPGGRAAGAPLDLHTLSVNPPSVPAASAPAAPISTANPVTAMPMPAAVVLAPLGSSITPTRTGPSI